MITQNNQQGSSPTLKTKNKMLLPLALVLTILAFGSLAYASYKTYYSVSVEDSLGTSITTRKPEVIDSIPQFDYDSVQLSDGITAYPDSKIVEVSRGVNRAGQEIDRMLFNHNRNVSEEEIANYYKLQLEDHGWQIQKSEWNGCEESTRVDWPCHYVWYLNAQKDTSEIHITVAESGQHLIEMQNGLPKAIVLKLSDKLQPYLQDEGLELTGLFGVYFGSDNYVQRMQFNLLMGNLSAIMKGLANARPGIEEPCGVVSSHGYDWGGCLDSIIGPFTRESYNSAFIYPEHTFMFTLKKPY